MVSFSFSGLEFAACKNCRAAVVLCICVVWSGDWQGLAKDEPHNLHVVLCPGGQLCFSMSLLSILENNLLRF